MTTTIPADFRPLLVECLLGALRHAVEAVEQCGLHPDAYPEPLSEFDAIRGALDALGWAPPQRSTLAPTVGRWSRR